MIEDDELRGLFQAECEERLKSLEEALKKLEKQPEQSEAIESAFRDAHTIKGSARMLALAPIEAKAHEIEEVLDEARKKGSISYPQIRLLFNAISSIYSHVSNEVKTERSIGTLASYPPIENRSAPAHLEKEEDAKPQEALPEPETGTSISLDNQEPADKKQVLSPASTVRVAIQQVNDLIDCATDLAVAKNRLSRLFERVDHLLDRWQLGYRVMQQPLRLIEQNVHERDRKLDERTISSIHAIMDIFKEFGEELGDLRTEALENVSSFEALSGAMMEKTGKLGLLPLAKLFDFFPHRVRELADNLGKQTDLIIEGGEIGVDKKIIEDMKDPLMHLLRNAVSHGIESPQERLAVGKNPCGQIILRATQGEGVIAIEVVDDGRGLDEEKIKRAALEKGFIRQEKADALSSSELLSLIQLPGFSTASEVNEVSGRGVGMDIVNNEVQKLHGKITMRSEKGKGCHFQVVLPLTLTILDVVLAKCSNCVFGFAADAIERCLLLKKEEMGSLEGFSVTTVDKQPVSLLFLNSFLNQSDSAVALQSSQPLKAEMDLPCLLFSEKNKKIALVVDEFLCADKVVVTPPDLFLSKISSLIGTAILKTGEVCAILNPFAFHQRETLS